MGWRLVSAAFFDDGTPLGSVTDAECRIDSISQSWAVISGAADPARTARAMAAVERELIRSQDQLALLFTPPFDKTPHDPGYIKGYRQASAKTAASSTHTALWSVMAFAALGEGDKAAGLFSLLNPINQPALGRMSTATRWNPMSSPLTSMPPPPHVGRGGWTWYTGSADGCNEPASRAFSGRAFGATSWNWARAFRRHGRASR